MSTATRIAVDAGRCGGLGLCASLAPDVFSVGEEGYSVVDHAAITEENEEDVIDAVHTCPAEALRIEGAGS